MTMFIRGNDKGFVLLKSIIIIFFLFLALLTVLEFEYRRFARTKRTFEHTLVLYEKAQKELP